MYENLLVDTQGKVSVVTINRPQALNALNMGVLNELEDFFKKIQSSESRVIVLTGSGDKAFVAGADIKEISNLDQKASRDFALKGQRVFSTMEELPQVIIGAVNGFALGGGLELALSCDFLIASPHAKFGLPEVSLGLIPGFGGTQRLARAIGINKARELIYTARHMNAQEALDCGLINSISEGSVVEKALQISTKILSNGPTAISHAKNALNKGYDMELSCGLQLEAERFSALFDKPEQKEGVAAFLEKRKPNFK